MKKRNWVLEGILCSVLCFIVFGCYMTQAKGMGEFMLEDIEGDRAALSAFPLEGHGGGQRSSFQYTVSENGLQVRHYSYGVSDLERLMQAEQNGMLRWMGHFRSAPLQWDVEEDTMPVVAEDSQVTEENISKLNLFEDYRGDEAEGETVTMDAADIFCEIGRWVTTRRSGSRTLGYYVKARYDTGLTLRDKPYFYTGDGTWSINNYNSTVTGEQLDRLSTYTAQIGDTIYAVTAPDERCEGQTYVFRLEMADDREIPEDYEESSPEKSAYDRSAIGEAVPIIPIPDVTESRVVGLAAVDGQERLLLYRADGQRFFADLYDTQGKLLDSAEMQLANESERYESVDYEYEYEDFIIASEVYTTVVPWEEGNSVEIAVSGYLQAKENENQFGGVMMTTGRMLLWIEPDGSMEQLAREEGERAVVRGGSILYLTWPTPEEEEQIFNITGYGTGSDQCEIRVCDRSNGEVLYRGLLKTDFWQDDLGLLAEIDTGKRADYTNQQIRGAYFGEDRRSMKLYIAGEWRGRKW